MNWFKLIFYLTSFIISFIPYVNKINLLFFIYITYRNQKRGVEQFRREIELM